MEIGDWPAGDDTRAEHQEGDTMDSEEWAEVSADQKGHDETSCYEHRQSSPTQIPSCQKPWSATKKTLLKQGQSAMDTRMAGDFGAMSPLENSRLGRWSNK